MVHGSGCLGLARYPLALAFCVLEMSSQTMGNESRVSAMADDPKAQRQVLFSKNAAAMAGPRKVVMSVGDELKAKARTRFRSEDVSEMMMSRT